MSIAVLGLGIVSKIGNVEDLGRLMDQDSIDPQTLRSVQSLPLEFSDAYDVPQKLIRRMSHFAKLSLLSACEAIKDSGLEIRGKSVGIIQGSVYGPIISGIQAFDELIDFGDNQLSPTNFSGSVFNTAATYLSLAFNIQGSTLSHTSGLDTLYHSFLSASHWLESGIADYVILGIGDEYTPYFDINESNTQHPTGLVPDCEGWTTLLLGKEGPSKYGRVNFGQLCKLPETKGKKNIYSFWHEQIDIANLNPHVKDNQPCFPVHLRGSYPSASGFDLALALLCAKNGKFPLYDRINHNYHNIDISKDEGIRCVSVSENQGFFYFDIITNK